MVGYGLWWLFIAVLLAATTGNIYCDAIFFASNELYWQKLTCEYKNGNEVYESERVI